MDITIHVCDNQDDADKAQGQLVGLGLPKERTAIVPVPKANPPSFRIQAIGADNVEVRNGTSPNRDIWVVVGLDP
jgi:hypothetical protein